MKGEVSTETLTHWTKCNSGCCYVTSVFCEKLHHYGVTGRSLGLLESYLRGRIQTVVVKVIRRFWYRGAAPAAGPSAHARAFSAARALAELEHFPRALCQCTASRFSFAMKLLPSIVCVIAVALAVSGAVRVRGRVRRRHAAARRGRAVLPPCPFNATIVNDEVVLMAAIEQSSYIFTGKVLSVKKYRPDDRPNGKRSDLYRVHVRRSLKGDTGEVSGVQDHLDESVGAGVVLVEKPQARESCAPRLRPRLSAVFLCAAGGAGGEGGPPRLRLVGDPIPLTLYHLDRVNAAVKGNLISSH
ncbi:hypothetical protein EVAR_9315_1 [Eumeta japonica]|uniref:Uncharacterized protein n=1 Tax=Eumeta variegata TaxID=151549 RepID=A0A4C1TLT6_EUMVA|nr:hypothetical protein EVAR_9315_1 [Eumeta japonica]